MALLDRLITINLKTVIRVPPLVDLNPYLDDFALFFQVLDDRLNKFVVSF
jgi:hypothetical protein